MPAVFPCNLYYNHALRLCQGGAFFCIWKGQYMQFDTQFWVQILIYVAGFAAMWGNVTTRLGYLEQKMDKHNNLQERMAVVEQSAKSAHHRIDDIKEEVIHEKLD